MIPADCLSKTRLKGSGSFHKVIKEKVAQVKHFIRKHKSALGCIGLIAGLGIAVYLLPTDQYPERMDRIHERVGESNCDMRQVVLRPGIKHDTWEHRVVDGNDGRYAWQVQGHEGRFFARTHHDNPHELLSENGEQSFNSRDFQGPMNRFVNVYTIRFQLDRALPIRQLQVVQQRGNTCAYHALKNCRLIMQELIRPQGNLQTQLDSPEVVQDLIGIEGQRQALGRWRGHIVQNHLHLCSIQEGDYIGEWLHPEGLQELINHENEQDTVTMMPAGRFQEQLLQNPLERDPLFDVNENDPDQDVVHGFVVQNRAHWITAVLRKVGDRIEWLIADSNNQDAFNRVAIWHLLANLHGRHV